MVEFKIVTGDAREVQTILNQWRHKYTIIIQGFKCHFLNGSANNTYYHVLVEREKKDE